MTPMASHSKKSADRISNCSPESVLPKIPAGTGPFPVILHTWCCWLSGRGGGLLTIKHEAFYFDARKGGIVTCAPVEKSGQAVFDFEPSHEFGQPLGGVAPTFAKALVL